MFHSLRGNCEPRARRYRAVVPPPTPLYHANISKSDILDAKTERQLLLRYRKTHDIDARDRIIRAALRFVVKLAVGYARNRETTDDLVSAGSVGLLVAIDRYDLRHKTRFLSYATSWVLLEMRNALYNDSLVAMPLWRQKALGRLRKVNAKSLARSGKNATIAELHKQVDLSPLQLVRLQEYQTVYITRLGDDTDALPSKGSDNGRGVDSLAMNNETREILRASIRQLKTVKEQFVVRAYFGLVTDPLSLRQIAGVLGVSSERVRQIKSDALRFLEQRLKGRLRITSICDMKN